MRCVDYPIYHQYTQKEVLAELWKDPRNAYFVVHKLK